MATFWCSMFEVVEYGGVERTAYEWADRKGVPWETVKKRVQRGSGWRKALELCDDDLLPQQGSLFKVAKTRRGKSRRKHAIGAPCYYLHRSSPSNFKKT